MAEEKVNGEKKDAAYYAQLAEKYTKAKDPEKANAARVLQNRAAFDLRQENAAAAVEQAKELLGEEA